MHAHCSVKWIFLIFSSPDHHQRFETPILFTESSGGNEIKQTPATTNLIKSREDSSERFEKEIPASANSTTLFRIRKSVVEQKNERADWEYSMRRRLPSSLMGRRHCLCILFKLHGSGYLSFNQMHEMVRRPQSNKRQVKSRFRQHCSLLVSLPTHFGKLQINYFAEYCCVHNK